jgi:hypothetical protein
LKIYLKLSFKKYSIYSGNIDISFPLKEKIKVDGYVTVTGTNNSGESLYLGTKTGSDVNQGFIEQLYEIPDQGAFTKTIYFTNDGSTLLLFLKKDAANTGYYNYYGYTQVTNQPSADLQYLLPSEKVQVYDSQILAKAQELYNNSSCKDHDALALYVHDYLVKYIAYDYEGLVNGTYGYYQDALTVLTSGKAVCTGYSTLYSAILRAMGIPALVVTGTTIEGSEEGHAWNQVYWEGTWHNVDVTWDDPSRDDGSGQCYSSSSHEGCTNDFPDGENLRYDYFDISDEKLAEDHITDGVADYYSVQFDF